MENLPRNISLEQAEADIQAKIAFAKEHALTQQEYEEIMQAEYEVAVIENKRKLSDDEVSHYSEFRKRINESTVRVETLPEARRVMEVLGASTYSTNDTIEHENAHANRADQLGATHNGYNFVLIKSDDGGYNIQPQASIYVPDEWNQEKQEIVLNEITRAPEDYGNKLSDGDKRILNGGK